MAKFTKGPWKIMEASNYDGFAIAPKNTLPTLASVERCGAGRIQINCFNFPADAEANAHLIAAAPEMYEALKGLYHNCESTSKYLDAAHDALNKAKGGDE